MWQWAMETQGRARWGPARLLGKAAGHSAGGHRGEASTGGSTRERSGWRGQAGVPGSARCGAVAGLCRCRARPGARAGSFGTEGWRGCGRECARRRCGPTGTWHRRAAERKAEEPAEPTAGAVATGGRAGGASAEALAAALRSAVVVPGRAVPTVRTPVPGVHHVPVYTMSRAPSVCLLV